MSIEESMSNNAVSASFMLNAKLIILNTAIVIIGYCMGCNAMGRNGGFFPIEWLIHPFPVKFTLNKGQNPMALYRVLRLVIYVSLKCNIVDTHCK